jgi:hypothetical protein
MDLRKIEFWDVDRIHPARDRDWIGFIWLRIETGGGFLSTRGIS